MKLQTALGEIKLGANGVLSDVVRLLSDSNNYCINILMI